MFMIHFLISREIKTLSQTDVWSSKRAFLSINLRSVIRDHFLLRRLCRGTLFYDNLIGN